MILSEAVFTTPFFTLGVIKTLACERKFQTFLAREMIFFHPFPKNRVRFPNGVTNVWEMGTFYFLGGAEGQGPNFFPQNKKVCGKISNFFEIFFPPIS